MKGVTIKLTPELVELFGSQRLAKRNARLAVVLDLVRRAAISRSKAAELLGIPLAEFPRLLSEYHIPWFDASTATLRSDLRTLGRHARRTR